MLVECLSQCQITTPGTGHPAERTKALFPGQTYEVDDELAAPLIASGHLRALGVYPEFEQEAPPAEPEPQAAPPPAKRPIPVNPTRTPRAPRARK